MGVEETEGLRIAHMLNYKQGTFPFIYLGLPVSDRALSEGDWGPLTTKVGKRAEPWMRKLMSSAARLTIINACLSNLPLHAMAICLLGEGIHVTLDKHRSRFFWEANSTKRKYHWVRWSAMCNPKSLGGLGIVDTRLMNICLLVKWIWRLYDGEQGLWADIIRNKYLRDKDLLLDTHRTGSQLWIAIQKLKHLFKLGAKHLVQNGNATSFWRDWWQGSGPLTLDTRLSSLLRKSLRPRWRPHVGKGYGTSPSVDNWEWGNALTGLIFIERSLYPSYPHVRTP
jgi:hypothetical protein